MKNPHMPRLLATAALILAASLTACGFHLRGGGGGILPYKTWYIAVP